MNEIRKSSLLFTINDYIKTIKSAIKDQENIEEEIFEDFFVQIINRDRDYMINVIQNDIEELNEAINQIASAKNKLEQNYAISTNQLSIKNQKIRRKIKAKILLLNSNGNFNERKKKYQNLYDQIYFWLLLFQKTILEIKDKNALIKNEIQTLRAEISAISSNNLIDLRFTKNRISMAYEKIKSVEKYQKEEALLIEKEKYKRKISKYKNMNAEFEKCFNEIVDILGKFYLDPKSLLLNLKRKTLEEQIAQEINDDYPNTKIIAQMLKGKCDLAFENKEKEINSCLKKMEIKEMHIKEKLHLATLNCGIPTNQNPTVKVYSPRFSPKRDPVDILINHKSLRFASWEESSKILNQTFDEIERLRQSRSSIYSILNSNDSFE